MILSRSWRFMMLNAACHALWDMTELFLLAVFVAMIAIIACGFGP